jgi:signal transduction histidine kinase
MRIIEATTNQSSPTLVAVSPKILTNYFATLIIANVATTLDDDVATLADELTTPNKVAAFVHEQYQQRQSTNNISDTPPSLRELMDQVENQNQALSLANQKLERMARELAQRNQETLELSQAIHTTAENERASIASELHDAVVNPFETQLTHLKARLAAGLSLTPAELQNYVEGLTEIRASLRRGLQNLHAAELKEHGLYAAIIYLARRITKGQAIKLHLKISDSLLNDDILSNISEHIQHAIYRITQQALQNVLKHAQAKNVTICLDILIGSETTEATPVNKLILRITDDGKGFKVPVDFVKLQVAGHNGLAGFVQKVKLLGGILNIASQIGQGTTISIEVPIMDASLAPNIATNIEVAKTAQIATEHLELFVTRFAADPKLQRFIATSSGNSQLIPLVAQLVAAITRHNQNYAKSYLGVEPIVLTETELMLLGRLLIQATDNVEFYQLVDSAIAQVQVG